MQVNIERSLRSSAINNMFSLGLTYTFKGVFMRVYGNGNSRKLTWIIFPKDEVGEYIFDKWSWNPPIYLQKRLRDFFPLQSPGDYIPGSQTFSAASSLKMVLIKTTHNNCKHTIIDPYLGVSDNRLNTSEVEYKQKYNCMLVLHRS